MSALAVRRIATAVAVSAAILAVPGVARAADHPVSFPTGAAAAPYSPDAVEASPGDTVTFSGAFALHPLVWNTGDFATQSSGTTAQFTFAKGGLYAFHCQIHASMTGSVHVAGNAFATPDFGWAPVTPQAGQAVAFSAAGFADPDGTVVRYEWDLDGNGSFESTGAQTSHTYPAAGAVTVALRYVDDGHETSPATAHVVSVASGPAGGGGGGGGTGLPPGPGGAGAGTGTGTTPAAPGRPGAGSTTMPSGPAGSAPTGSGTARPGLRVTARSVAFRRGLATVALSVTEPATARLTLRRSTTVLARGTGSVRPGAARVPLKLTAAGARQLRRAHTLRATLTTVVRDRAGATATVKRTLTVRLRG
ncbi:MAG TPA: PKD domain-containing protein [Baekduia sp.]|jgi:plastocyanin|nr:PKD domain-containing protein [Baekduia sp.]